MRLFKNWENTCKKWKGGSFISAKMVPTFKDVAEAWLKHKKLQIGLDSWGNHERNLRLHLNKFYGLKIRVYPNFPKEFSPRNY